jgi:hypothetical protein
MEIIGKQKKRTAVTSMILGMICILHLLYGHRFKLEEQQ